MADHSKIASDVIDLRNLWNEAKDLRSKLKTEPLAEAPSKAEIMLDSVLNYEEVSQAQFDALYTAIDTAEEHRKVQQKLDILDQKYETTKNHILGTGSPGTSPRYFFEAVKENLRPTL